MFINAKLGYPGMLAVATLVGCFHYVDVSAGRSARGRGFINAGTSAQLVGGFTMLQLVGQNKLPYLYVC